SENHVDCRLVLFAVWDVDLRCGNTLLSRPAKNGGLILVSEYVEFLHVRFRRLRVLIWHDTLHVDDFALAAGDFSSPQANFAKNGSVVASSRSRADLSCNPLSGPFSHFAAKSTKPP